MSDRAWMPLYIADYLADTGHLTAAEHGAYLLLIMRYWQDGGLPADERLISRYSRLSASEWSESRDVIAALFEDGWKHKRIDDELEKASAIIAKRRGAANARHGAKKNDAHAVHVESKCSDTGALPVTKNITDANASDAAGVDPRDALWRDGVSSLKAITGKTDGAARALVGKWLKSAGDDCSLVLAKIIAAQRERIGEPVAWITAAITPATGPPPKPRNAGEAARLELKRMGVYPDATSTHNGHEDEGDGRPGFAGTGIARRIAIASG